MDRYDGMRLRIERKKLKSGNCQIKFHWRTWKDELVYGYFLQEESIPIKQLANEIRLEMEEIESIASFYHKPLFSLGQYRVNSGVKETMHLFKA